MKKQNMLRRVLALGLSALMLCGTFVTALAFDDVSDSSDYAAAISSLQSKGIAKGVSSDSFNPDAPVTAAQLAAFLSRIAGEDAGDLDACLAWAADAGLIDDRLSRNDTLSVSDAQEIMERFCTQQGVDRVSVTGSEPITRGEIAIALDAADELIRNAPVATAHLRVGDSGTVLYALSYDLDGSALTADDFTITIITPAASEDEEPVETPVTVKSVEQSDGKCVVTVEETSYTSSNQLQVTCSDSAFDCTEKTASMSTLTVDEFKHDTFTASDGTELSYWLYTPEDVAEAVPLMVWEHGGGEVLSSSYEGANLTANRGAVVWAESDIPTAVLSVQYPENYAFEITTNEEEFAQMTAFNTAKYELIQKLIADGTADASRIYISGASSGGGGVLRFLMQYPELFAAALPICSKDTVVPMSLTYDLAYKLDNVDDLRLTDEEYAVCYQAFKDALAECPELVDVPIWFVHAENDPVCTSYTSIMMYDALKEMGAENNKITLYNDEEMLAAGQTIFHTSWVLALNDQDMIDWVYAQEKEQPTVTHTVQEKARTVITTDGEVDDMNSVIRALLYANDMDICGIVLTSSMYHYAGDEEAGIEPYRWTGTQWIYDFLDDYEEVYPNLKAHDSDYPTADYLRSVTHIGNISNKGEMDEITDGSEFLKELFLDDDPRTLYVQTWGGTNTTARALKSIEEEYKDTEEWETIQKKVSDKLVLYIILDQDESYSNYIATNWPDLTIINDRSNFWHFAYAWTYHSDELNDTLKAEWNLANLMDKGALMDNYALMGDGKLIDGELYEEQRGTDDYLTENPDYERYDFISEGDSPSFLYLIDTGLRSLEDPSYGGWGGRFGQVSDSLYQNTVLDYEEDTAQFEAQYTLSRWFEDFQNDFANRADWCTTSDDSAVNHAPTVEVLEGIDLTAAAGETVTLTAQGADQDGDNLSYSWWRYYEADTYQDSEPTTEAEDVDVGMLLNIVRKPDEDEVLNSIEITGADQAAMSFTVPADAKSGDTIHMIVEVQDDGAHTLKHYQRVIITVS